jgi:hypothetical protein
MRLHGLLNQVPMDRAAVLRWPRLAAVASCARNLRVWMCFLALSALGSAHLIAAPSESSPLPSLLPGAAIDAGQWRVRPLRAWLSSEHPLRRPAVPGASYLLVEVELTNLMQRSSRDFAFVLHIDQPELKQLGEPSFVLVRDMELPDRLHPNMPEALLLAWPWPAGREAPGALRVAIHAKIFKAVDNLVGSPGWFNARAIATATLPLSAQ